jgi:hypothetical protein
MTLGSLTCGAEVDEDPDRSDTTLFPRENPVMTVGAQGYNDTSFPISLYIYVKMYITVTPKGKRKKEHKNDGADNPKPRARRPALAQFHGSVPEACASCRHSKMRPATVKTSQADFGSSGMSWTGSMPRSTRALEIPMTSCDSRPATMARSSLIPSTRLF